MPDGIVGTTADVRHVEDILMADLIRFSCRSKEFAYLSNLYEVDFTIDDITYHHVEGYLRSIMFANYNKKAAVHLRSIQSPRACRLVTGRYFLDSQAMNVWKSRKELEHMKIATTIKFVANAHLRNQLISTGSRPLLCCDADDEVSSSTKLLGSVLEGIRSIVQGIYIMELPQDSKCNKGNELHAGNLRDKQEPKNAGIDEKQRQVESRRQNTVMDGSEEENSDSDNSKTGSETSSDDVESGGDQDEK